MHKAVLAGVAFAALLGAEPSLAASKLEPIVLPPPAAPGRGVLPYVKVASGSIALAHVKLMDGSGRPQPGEHTILVKDGKIAAIQPEAAALPAGFTAIDLSGHTVLPGIVGMHDHMYYIARPNLDAAGHSEAPVMVPEMAFTSPRLYLANGVTTMRTTGSVEPYTDLNVKRQIDLGQLVGPHMDVTGPYLEGARSPFIQMHLLTGPEDARKTVAFWADQGVTSFKAYMNITRAELAAAIEEAHRRGLKITGHLCSVTYPEAAALGIDNLEHGFYPNTQDDPGKTPDTCPQTSGAPTLQGMEPRSPAAEALIKDLIARHVALTSTLPVFEQSVPAHAPLWPKAMDVLTSEAKEAYLYNRNRTNMAPRERMAGAIKGFQNDMGLEREFVSMGGLLLAGPDPTGNGGVIPGFADIREIELLVEAGFTPDEAVKIATLNGATYLGLQDRIGSIAVGKDADLMVVRGDPAQKITDLENVEIVFKDGVGYDSAALLNSVRGRYGQY